MKLQHQFFTEGQDVYDFHTKFMVPMASQPSLLDQQSFEFRLKFLQEELGEFVEAHSLNNLEKAADALIDLVYVAQGTALMMGLPWKKLWNRVQERNMAKERAKPDGSNSMRGNPLDVIKPEGWYPPDHTPDLGQGPWPVFNATEIAADLAYRLKEQAAAIAAKQGNVSSTSVEERDGKKHYTSMADPGNFKTRQS